MRLIILALTSLLLLIAPSFALSVNSVDLVAQSGLPVYTSHYYTVKLSTDGGKYIVVIKNTGPALKNVMIPYVHFRSEPAYYQKGDTFIVEGMADLFKSVRDSQYISSGFVRFEFTGQYIKISTNCSPYNGVNGVVKMYNATGYMWIGQEDSKGRFSKYRFELKPHPYFSTPGPGVIVFTVDQPATIGVGIPKETGFLRFDVRGVYKNGEWDWYNEWYMLKQTSVPLTAFIVYDATKSDTTYIRALYDKVSYKSFLPIGDVVINETTGYVVGATSALIAGLYLVLRRG